MQRYWFYRNCLFWFVQAVNFQTVLTVFHNIHVRSKTGMPLLTTKISLTQKIYTNNKLIFKIHDKWRYFIGHLSTIRCGPVTNASITSAAASPNSRRDSMITFIFSSRAIQSKSSVYSFECLFICQLPNRNYKKLKIYLYFRNLDHYI